MSNSPKKQNNNNRGDADGSGNSGRRILFLVIAALIGTLLINTLYTSLSRSYLVEISYDEFLTLLDEDKVAEVEFMTDDRLEILTKEEAAKAKPQQSRQVPSSRSSSPGCCRWRSCICSSAS